MTPGDNQCTQGVTTKARRGDIAVSPKSSVEPSEVQAPSLPLEIQKGRKPFIPPTKPEVTSYLTELGMNGTAEREAEKFLNHHDARGWWLTKGVKAKDWRAMARTWKGNAETFAARDSRSAPGTGNPKEDDAHIPMWNEWLKTLPPEMKATKHSGKEGFRYAADFMKTDFRKWWKQQEAAK